MPEAFFICEAFFGLPVSISLQAASVVSRRQCFCSRRAEKQGLGYNFLWSHITEVPARDLLLRQLRYYIERFADLHGSDPVRCAPAGTHSALFCLADPYLPIVCPVKAAERHPEGSGLDRQATAGIKITSKTRLICF